MRLLQNQGYGVLVPKPKRQNVTSYRPPRVRSPEKAHPSASLKVERAGLRATIKILQDALVVGGESIEDEA
ncbi:unnamed protein product [Cochlearia groenlandica]